MADCSSDEYSEDEIFFGKLTLKEIKKRLLGDHRQTITCGTETVRVSSDESINIIETHSEPDIYSLKDTVAFLDYSDASFASRPSMNWDIKSENDSFLKIEEMVTEFCTSPNKNQKDELDNTLEVVEFILNNAPLAENRNNQHVPIVNEKEADESVPSSRVTDSLKNCKDESKDNVRSVNTTNLDSKVIDCSESCPELRKANAEPLNIINVDPKSHITIETFHKIPSKTPTSLENLIQNDKINSIPTPLADIKLLTEDIFKTPKTPISKKNPTSSTKKTPRKTNAFQHITSPVASYIKNGPQVPLLRDVHPKKPLPSNSSIPKFVKQTNNDKGKENVVLPLVAYKSAKTTKMITVPDKEKLPQSSWAKKIASSLPKPVVIRHDHREVNTVKKPLLAHQENSFANLSLYQADVSVCTQKSAISK